jgi:hypothetical protein
MAQSRVLVLLGNDGHQNMSDRASELLEERTWGRTKQVLARLHNAYREGGAEGVAVFMRELRPSELHSLGGAELGWLCLGLEGPIADLPDLIRALVLAERIEYHFMRGSVSPVLYVFPGYADRVDNVDVRSLKTWIVKHTANPYIIDSELLNRGVWARQLFRYITDTRVEQPSTPLSP